MTAKNDKVVVRIPPSPTGYLHIGTARTALFNYLFAKQHDGRIVLRSEDTDKERSKKEYEDDMIESLKWLGISWDEFSRQSEHAARYRELLERLIAEGKAFVSDETKNIALLDKEKKDADAVMKLRSEVIRLKNPGQKITFTDHIRGDITFDTTELGDFVIARSLDDALYHFAVVVDDMDAGVTHVIRGEDHISNTPRQILIQEAIGAPRPIYAHIPLILDAKRAKLSKRKHGDEVWIRSYREKGYLSEALINFIALMGWSPQSQPSPEATAGSAGGGKGEDVLTLDELVKKFSLEKVQKGGAVFNKEKLNSLNKAHMLRLRHDALRTGVLAHLPERLQQAAAAHADIFDRALPLMIERIQVFGELAALAESGEFDFYFTAPMFADPKALFWKDAQDAGTTIKRLMRVRELLSAVPDFTAGSAKAAVWPYAEEEGRGAVLWPLRFALSGRAKSPDPFAIAAAIGKDETLARIDAAVAALHNA